MNLMRTAAHPTMSAVEELMAQRDRMMFGKWVNGCPMELGEACLGFYVERKKNGVLRTTDISDTAYHFLLKALREMGLPVDVTGYNDAPGRTLEEALDVMDVAIKLAKEQEDNG